MLLRVYILEFCIKEKVYPESNLTRLFLALSLFSDQLSEDIAIIFAGGYISAKDLNEIKDRTFKIKCN